MLSGATQQAVRYRSPTLRKKPQTGHQLLHLSFLFTLLCVSAVTDGIEAVSTLLEEAW